MAAAAGARRPFFRRRKTCPFSGDNAPKIDYKDVRLMQRYISSAAKSFRPVSPPFRRRSNANWPRLSNAHAFWAFCPTS